MRANIYVTDDEQALRSAISRKLGKSRHRVTTFESGEALLEGLEHDTPDIILLDLKMGGMTGIETLEKVRVKAPQILVILLTAYGTVEDAVAAMRLGAYDFLIKSIDMGGVEPVVNRALEFLSLRRRVAQDNEEVTSRFNLNTLIAESQTMRDLVGQIQELSQNQKSTVLLLGETGTGKEFIARVLHHNGSRRDSAFVGVNCTAIPRELFESELFGYERGAFTGANQRKIGLFEQAEGGTLFLDEIGDLDGSMQAKLLRVLQERSFRRVGGAEDIEVDFRLIAATNKDLKKEVSNGTFREDLFFRLNVVSLELPPLRQRVEDIIPLCMQALLQYGKEFGKDIVDIEPEARTLLERYTYPGNIRELQNIIERAVIFCHGKTLSSGELPRDIHQASELPVSTSNKGEEPVIRVEMRLGQHTLAEIEASIIQEVMYISDQNKSLAAKHLGVSRFTLDRRLKKILDDE